MRDLSKYQTYLEMPDQEFEDLILEAQDDQDITTAFIESNAEDFEMWCYEHGIHHDYAMDHETGYIDHADEAFFEFAFNWYKQGGKL